MDLFIRTSNRLAIDMYKFFGFEVSRSVIGYYGIDSSDGEDAFGTFSVFTGKASSLA
jgi:N-terminal acetyltransferase B complex catalytic subunit